MFKFGEKSRRKLTIHQEDHSVVMEIGPEWHLGYLALSVGAILFVLDDIWKIAGTALHLDQLGTIPDFVVFAVRLVTFVLALAIAKSAALQAISKEQITVDRRSGGLTIRTVLWKFTRIEQFPISGIRDLHSQHSNWLNGKERMGVEFYHEKYGYRLAQGASSEDREHIVHVLVSAGASPRTLAPST